MLISIVGTDLPGRSCGPSPDAPDGYGNIHVAVQGRKGQQDLFGLTPGNARSASWELECEVISPPPEMDVRGAQIRGRPRSRFLYLTWGVVGADKTFAMFRRAKLLLDAVPPETMAAAFDAGILIGTVGLTDEKGNPLCASVRPPRINWAAPAP